MAQNPADSKAKLIGLADPVKGKEFTLTGPVKIGRDQKSANVPVVHASVSRQHASIVQEGDVWVVEDLKSTNGVFVNEARTAKAQLKNGDVVRIGDIPFRFELLQAQAPVAPQEPPSPDEALTIQAVRAPAAPPSRPPVPAVSRPPAPAPAPPPPPPVFQPAARAQTPPAPPAPPPPVARPAPPPPVARPAPPPQAFPQPQKEAGGEDLFEPSIVGNVNIGAAMAGAAQAAHAAQAAPAPRPAARQPEDFEGTMYGAQVARQLVKAIREEKPVPEDSGAKQKGAVVPQVIIAGKVSKPPSFLWLKIKFLVFFLVGIGVIAGLLIWAQIKGKYEEAMRDAFRVRKSPVDDFVKANEDKVGGDTKSEILTLDQLRQKIEEPDPKFTGDPDWTGKIKRLEDRVALLTFERKLKLAIDKSDKDGAERLTDEMSSKCTQDQRRFLPLCKLAVRYEIFKKKYPDPPENATVAPALREVTELMRENAEYSRQFRDYSSLFGEAKQLYQLAKAVNDYDLPFLGNWEKFWNDYKSYQEDKAAAKLEQLKKDYPQMKLPLPPEKN